MEREVMREIIIRNRKALGMSIADDLLIDMLVESNSIVSIAGMLKSADSTMVLADGLIVGYEL